MIEISNLQKYYHSKCVLRIPSLHIPKGQCFGLVGNNGAGKTTLFSLLLDLVAADSGEITSNGLPVHKTEAWKPYTAAFIDESFLIGYLTPEEYFYFIGELRGMRQGEVDQFLQQYTDFFQDEVLGKNKYIRDFSKGNQKKIGITAAFMGNPSVIILDEPFANLDPSTQIRMKSLFKSITARGETTLLLSSHDLIHTTEVCDRIVVLHRGTIVKDIQTDAATLHDLEQFFSSQLTDSQ